MNNTGDSTQSTLLPHREGQGGESPIGGSVSGSPIPAEFDDIRPYSPEELPAVYEELIADEAFRRVIEKVMPGIPFEAIAMQMRQCKTNLEFQKAFCYPFLHNLVKKCSDGMSIDCSAIQGDNCPHTFITNHRDIVLDSALLSVLLVDNGQNTVEIAIGDNLLIFPWIKKLVRINKSFIVQRALTMRQMLEASARMSRYMHFAIDEKKENIWIAQREGRAKDSDDRTQDSVLKMMAMGGEGSIVERLKGLNISPAAISYEYDPCDYLKAKEYQQKRDIPDFKKSREDDLLNMQTGIFGRKGRIHFQLTPCINDKLDALDPAMPKTEIFSAISAMIDQQIHANYRFYPGNYVAYDWLTGENRFADKYSSEEKAVFEQYIAGQLAKIDLPDKDEAFLCEKMLAMYANPVKNYLKAMNID